MSGFVGPEDMPMGAIPPGLVLKAKKLAQERIDAARYRVRVKATRMTPKKAKNLDRVAKKLERERARRREAWQKAQDQGHGIPIYNQPNQVGPWPDGMDIPVSKARFTPRAGLVDIPFDLKEGVKQQIMERGAVPDDKADKIASNAIDRWMTVVQPKATADEPTPYIPVTQDPKFLIHPFSDVDYQWGDSLQNPEPLGLGGLGDDRQTSVVPDFNMTSEAYNPEALPIADPTTREPLTPSTTEIQEKVEQAVAKKNTEVAKKAIDEVKGKNGGSLVIPLAIGAGLLIYMLAQKGSK